MTPAIAVLGGSAGLLLYAYLGYPIVLWALGKVTRRALPTPDAGDEWPSISIAVPAYNEEAVIQDLIETLLSLDYPKDRIQILVVSDCSADRTDEIVASYADRGVELLRLEERGGKTKAENAAMEHLRGEIIVNTDASVRISADALKPMIATFKDPEIGLASGRDVSIGTDESSNESESTYVGYEMAVRDLETTVSGIVGASGCFYAIRADLHRLPLPGELSRDFAAALRTKQNGYRAVSVPDAVCYVPRATSLRREYRRKVRTITRGMSTLWYLRSLLNPFRYGWISWMLASHKITRWALPWAAMASVVALGVLAPQSAIAAVLFGGALLGLALAAIGWVLAGDGAVPKLFAVPAYLAFGNLAAAHALVRVLGGVKEPLWEPTRRPTDATGTT